MHKLAQEALVDAMTLYLAANPKGTYSWPCLDAGELVCVFHPAGVLHAMGVDGDALADALGDEMRARYYITELPEPIVPTGGRGPFGWLLNCRYHRWVRAHLAARAANLVDPGAGEGWAPPTVCSSR